MIRSFNCKFTRKLYNNIAVPEWSNIQKAARRKLEMIDAAISLESLKVPPSNHLEKLRGDRSGSYSIRINDQYRICFTFDSGNFYDVEIVDCH